MYHNVLDWLEATALGRPESIAFADAATEITYQETVQKARSVGSVLAEQISIGEPVALYLEKSTTAICGMFGAVYAGGFYTILDVRQPDARLQQVLRVLEPKVILTDRENEEKAALLQNTVPVLVIEDIWGTTVNEKILDAVRASFTDVNPLYTNFTSGSTGVPKGVAVSHRSVLEFIDCFVKLFDITEEDVIGNQAPFDFDVSVKDIYSGIATGARVQIIPREYFSNPTHLMDYLSEKKVTTLIWAVSAMCFVSIMNGFEYRIPETVNKVMFSGEVLPIKHLNKWKKFLPDAKYINLYGPTEITCNCTYYILDREFEETETIPMGKAFPNEKVFLLDEEDHLVTPEEIGKQGEICVSGTALALGYYNDKERTAQVFVQNPLNHSYMETIYRTGDIGKYDGDGNFIYVSRKDFQIKHLGHRIELGEIETAAMAEDGVTRACCIYETDKKRILLFYTGERDKKELSKALRTILPPFMIPNTLIPLAEMPMNKNGKIDRKKLLEDYLEGKR